MLIPFLSYLHEKVEWKTFNYNFNTVATFNLKDQFTRK